MSLSYRAVCEKDDDDAVRRRRNRVRLSSPAAQWNKKESDNKEDAARKRNDMRNSHQALDTIAVSISRKLILDPAID